MADRNSAEIFSKIFELLAEDRPLDRKVLAKQVWDMGLHYDFSLEQMECDKALFKLKLARKGTDPDYPEDGEVILYGPTDENACPSCGAVGAFTHETANRLDDAQGTCTNCGYLYKP